MEAIRLLEIAILIISANCQDTSDFVFETNFSRLVHSKYYVDKSLLLKELLDDGQHNFVHFMGFPHEFGRTVNIQMMKHFFQIPLDENGKEIFDKYKTPNFELFRFSKFYKEAPLLFQGHFGQHPVIHIDYQPLTDVSSYGQMVQKLSMVIRNTYLEHQYVLEHGNVFKDNVERMMFVQYCDERHSRMLDTQDIEESFIFLSEILYKYHNRQAIILIDNHFSFYEGMLAKNSTDMDKVFDLFRRVQKPINVIPHDYIFRCISTGLMTFTHHGKVTFLFQEYNFFQHSDFNKYFGMTKDELKETLHKFTTDKIALRKYYIHIFYFYKYRITEEEPMFKTPYVLKYLERRTRGVYQDLKDHVPKIMPLLPALVRSVDIKKELILAINDVGIRLEDFKERFDTEDLIALRSVLEGKQISIVGFTRRLLYMLLTKLGYFVFEDSASILAEKYNLLLPNSVVKSEIKFILEQSMKQQYRIKNYFIYKLTNAIRNTTESNYDLQLSKIVHHSKQLFRVSEFHPMGLDLQCEIYSLLSRKFDMVANWENITGCDEVMSYQISNADFYTFIITKKRLLDIQFKNKDIWFYIDSAVIRDENEQKKTDCVRQLTDRTIERRRSRINNSTSYIFIGLCYGVLSKTVSVGVARIFANPKNPSHNPLENKQFSHF